MKKRWIEVKNKCSECGKQVIAKYQKGDALGRCYAEVTCLCPKCAGYLTDPDIWVLGNKKKRQDPLD